jgi:hypothetical protein
MDEVATMRRRLDPQARWIRRFVLGRRLDRNPLRRASDRAETLVLAGLVTALLAGAPFAALAGGGFAHDLAQHMQQSQQAARTQVTAVTLEAAPASVKETGFAPPVARARWAAPDGRAVTGEVPVTLGTPAGAKVPVWTTVSGELTAAPLQDTQIASLVTLGQGVSALTLAVVVALAWSLARQSLDRRRYAAWDADWQAADPRGTQHK